MTPEERADRLLRLMVAAPLWAAAARWCTRHPGAAVLIALVAFALLFPLLP